MFILSGTLHLEEAVPCSRRSPYQWQHEPVPFYLAGRKKAKHNWYADRKQTTIWEFEKPRKTATIPTMKPVALGNAPDSTTQACRTASCSILSSVVQEVHSLPVTKRIVCYTIELDEKYCDVIVKRYIEQGWKL